MSLVIKEPISTITRLPDFTGALTMIFFLLHLSTSSFTKLKVFGYLNFKTSIDNG